MKVPQKMRAHTARKLANVTPRQLRYWVEIGLVEPLPGTTGTPGRLWLFADHAVARAKAISEALRDGWTLQKIRQAQLGSHPALPSHLSVLEREETILREWAVSPQDGVELQTKAESASALHQPRYTQIGDSVFVACEACGQSSDEGYPSEAAAQVEYTKWRHVTARSSGAG